MHAERILHNWLSNVLPNLHKRRLEALKSVVSAAIRGGRLTVTGLGRAINSAAKEKHNIKRADRLLSNKKLESEIVEIYRAVAHELIGTTKKPLILVDWSDIEQSQTFFLLRASVPVKGRALTIYEEVHELSTKEKRKTHSNFLRSLKQILPEGCKPILVTDAGFRTPWFKQVQSIGWDFVGRVRNRNKVLLNGESLWIAAKSLYNMATGKPKLLRNSLLTASRTLKCNLVLYKAKLKGRVNLNRFGQKRCGIKSLKNAKRQREPLLLATSLNQPAKQVVDIYATRMQIEESFRDLKCTRFGFGLDYTRTYTIGRMKILVLIGSLAATFAWIYGKATEIINLHRQFQANSTKHKPVLSTIFIGIKAFVCDTIKFNSRTWLLALQQINIAVNNYAL